MKLLYVANIRLPTDKAHGYQIMKTCEALTKVGIEPHVIVANRKNSLAIEDPFAHYSVPPTFSIERLPVIDYMSSVPAVLNAPAFLLERWSFFKSLRAYASRHPKNIWYTRDSIAAEYLSRSKQERVFLELHALPPIKLIQKLKNVAGCICLTNWLKKTMGDHLPSVPAVMIPDAVDVSVFDPAVSREEARRLLGLDQNAEIVVYGGRFSTMEEGKGLGLLDAAVATITKTYPELQLILVGGTAEEFIRIEGRSPSRSTICVPLQPRDRLALYYRAADILAMPFPDLPHYAFEMSPLKMFEYLASATPIITSDLPSVRDVLNEQTAIFYPPGSLDGLVIALRTLLDMGPEARTEFARRGRKMVQAYTWQRRAEEITSFIKRYSSTSEV